jgi:uncharacterized protein with NRDE domain
LYSVKEVELLFPKDAEAGGTWFGVSSRKRLICLLNGGFSAHKRETSYRMSRGIIVTDLLTSENAISSIDTYNFNDIEPFTIVMVDWKAELRLYELVWDGAVSHFSEKPLIPHIWSSSLLYTEDMKRKREAWFSSFLIENSHPSEADILRFHKTAGDGNIESDVIMDRGFVKTKSITQFIKLETSFMRYEDLQTNLTSKHQF